MMSPTSQAAHSFSESEFCPLDRVEAWRLVPIPAAPPAIARDPDRREMWREAHLTRAKRDPRQTIAVTGCGRQTLFACWPLVGREPVYRGTRLVYLGSACNEEATRELEGEEGN